MSASTEKFRNVFQMSKSKINWYPGHMFQSMKQMQAKMRKMDCVIEVHDARIPFSGRNPLFFRNLVGSKPCILALNKVDLIDDSNKFEITEKLHEENCDNFVFINCLNQNCTGLENIMTKVVELVKKVPKQVALDTTSHNLMVIGIPNVGKSSLINALRNKILHKGKGTAVGGIPGITKSVHKEIKISTNPLIYLIDTPGILMPNIKDVECGMKLALCACIKDDVIGIIHIADFLLYWMNKTKNFIYVEKFNLSKPVDEIMPLLIKIAIDANKMNKIRNVINNSIEVVPDVNYSAQYMVSLFRKGKLGDLYLDG